MAALVVALRSLGSWILANVLDPRAWTVAGIVLTIGYMRGCEHAQRQHEQFMNELERVGKEQLKIVRAINDRNRKAHEEVESNYVKDLEDMRARNRELAERMQHGAGSVTIAGPDPSALRPLQAGGIKCYDAKRLSDSLLASLQRYAERIGRGYQQRLAGLAARLGDLSERGGSVAAGAQNWQRWGEQVGACPAPPKSAPEPKNQKDHGPDGKAVGSDRRVPSDSGYVAATGDEEP